MYHSDISIKSVDKINLLPGVSKRWQAMDWTRPFPRLNPAYERALRAHRRKRRSCGRHCDVLTEFLRVAFGPRSPMRRRSCPLGSQRSSPA